MRTMADVSVHTLLRWIIRTFNKKKYMKEKEELNYSLEKTIEKINEVDNAKMKYEQVYNEIFESLGEDTKQYINFLRQDLIRKSEQAGAFEEEFRVKWEFFQKRYREECRIKNINVYDYSSFSNRDRMIKSKKNI